MKHVAYYEIHPTQDHMVVTPDGVVIECKHAAAAMRVRDELNARDRQITQLYDDLAEANINAYME